MTGKTEYRDAVIKAVDHILTAQYPTGGWPQFFPPGKQYHRHITYNDGTNVDLMNLLRGMDLGRLHVFGRITHVGKQGVRCRDRLHSQSAGRRGRQEDGLVRSMTKSRSLLVPRRRASRSRSWQGRRGNLDVADEPRSTQPGGHRGGGSRHPRWFEDVKLTGIRQVVENGDKRMIPDPNAPPLSAQLSRSARIGRCSAGVTRWSSTTSPGSSRNAATATPGTAPGVMGWQRGSRHGSRSGRRQYVSWPESAIWRNSILTIMCLSRQVPAQFWPSSPRGSKIGMEGRSAPRRIWSSARFAARPMDGGVG